MFRHELEEFVPKAGGVFNADAWLSDEDGFSEEESDNCSRVDTCGLPPATQSFEEFLPKGGSVFNADAWLSDGDDVADAAWVSAWQSHRRTRAGADKSLACGLRVGQARLPSCSDAALWAGGKAFAARPPSPGACSTASTAASEGVAPAPTAGEAPAAPPELRPPPGLPPPATRRGRSSRRHVASR